MTIDVDPVIGKLGPLEFRWYGIIMAVAVVIGVWIMSRQLKVRGIHPEHALGIAVFGVPFGILGARLVHVLDNLGYYLDNPSKILGLRLVGLAIYGVVGGAVLGLYLYCRWRKLRFLRVVDATALAFPVAQIVGKCANIINGDTWGSATDLPWGITYTSSPFIDRALLGVATHPTPIYEQIWLLVVVGVLLVAMRRLMKVDGLAILSYVWLYSLGRFVISFWRENEPMLWGLNEAQVIALVVLILAPPLAYWLVRRAGAADKKDAVPAGESAGGAVVTKKAASNSGKKTGSPSKESQDNGVSATPARRKRKSQRGSK